MATPRQERRALNDEYNKIMIMPLEELESFEPVFPSNQELKDNLLIQGNGDAE